jgi:hypothetical protein
MTTSESHSTLPSEEQPTALSRREMVLFVSVLIFYAATRLVGLADYPIYFFCDEATQANLAEELIDNGLRDPDGNLFPPYFLNAKVYNLGLSIWMHASTVAVFGKSPPIRLRDPAVVARRPHVGGAARLVSPFEDRLRNSHDGRVLRRLHLRLRPLPNGLSMVVCGGGGPRRRHLL